MEALLKILSGVLLGVGVIVVGAGISLLMAWPVMWCWNYAVATTFALPKISWGVAWCLMFLATTFLKSNVSVNKS
jgi:hypothetical protein